MFLTSLLLSVITLNAPAMPGAMLGAHEGIIESGPIADSTCKPGQICASRKVSQKGCFYANFWNSSKGGTPLAIDVTETSSKTSYIYWVNNTNKNIGITGQAYANFYCP